MRVRSVCRLHIRCAAPSQLRCAQAASAAASRDPITWQEIVSVSVNPLFVNLIII